jgi:hypothetical protein
VQPLASSEIKRDLITYERAQKFAFGLRLYIETGECLLDEADMLKAPA